MFILVPRDDNYRSLPMIGDYSIIGPFKSIKSAWSFWKKHLADTTNTKYMVKALCRPGSFQ